MRIERIPAEIAGLNRPSPLDSRIRPVSFLKLCRPSGLLARLVAPLDFPLSTTFTLSYEHISNSSGEAVS